MTRRFLLRTPPRIKVLEAAGCIGDKRYTLEKLLGGGGRARVRSSDGSRTYRVIVVPRGEGVVLAYSDDNGTRYRRYIGYPILCVMMLLGLLPRDPRVEEALHGIPWRVLNEQYKRYSIVEDIVLREYVSARGFDPSLVLEYRDRVLEELGKYRVYYDGSLA